MMRDAEFGVVRVRAFGVYSMKVQDPEKFLKDVVGTDGYFTTDEITGQLKRTVVSSFSDLLGNSGIPVLDLAGNYEKISGLLRDRVQVHFTDHGLGLVKLFVENISLPPEVEQMIDKRTSMGIVGAGNFAQFQMANAMGQGGGGLATAGAEMAAGLSMGQAMMQGLNQPAAPLGGARAQAPAAQPASTVAADAEQRFLVLARTALKNTNGQLNAAMQGMLDNNRKRVGLSEEQAAALIDRARGELGFNSAAMDEYKEILMVFLADGHLSDDEKAILTERQVELGLSDEQVSRLEAEVRRG
jgi:membrane protease subunit (stomatin/prohibitin family)